jgi:hypothetical protein
MCNKILQDKCNEIQREIHNLHLKQRDEEDRLIEKNRLEFADFRREKMKELVDFCVKNGGHILETYDSDEWDEDAQQYFSTRYSMCKYCNFVERGLL